MTNRTIQNIVTALCIIILFINCKKSTEAVQPLKVQPPAILPIISNEVLTNGVNVQASYYNNGNVNFAWDLMKQQPKIKTVRIEIEPDKILQGKQWIAAAKSNGFTVIATYHKSKVLASDEVSELIAAANWWKDNYVLLGGNFTINLMNEWGSHTISAGNYASAYNDAIAIVRKVYNGAIIIDIPGYGQETLTAYQACTTSTPRLLDNNIVLSAHIYTNGYNEGRKHKLQASDLNDLSNTGRPCIIGEFGSGGGGSVDWKLIVQTAKSKGWPILGWAWNGGGLDGMTMVLPAWGTNATATSFTLGPYFTVINDLL